MILKMKLQKKAICKYAHFCGFDMEYAVGRWSHDDGVFCPAAFWAAYNT